MSTSNQTVDEYLRQQLDRNPGALQISLQFRAINDLLHYLHFLADFTNLKKLNLHGNRIKELPQDLSILSNLTQLNLTNNLLDDNIQLTLMSLKTLPKLRSLDYEVRKDKEKMIAQQLIHLEYLNSTRIVRQKPKEQYKFNNANEYTLLEFREKMIDFYREIQMYQVKYLGEEADKSACAKYEMKLVEQSKKCINILQKNKDNISETVQLLFLTTTKYQMFEELKMSTINLCMDIYDDVGKFVKFVLDEETKLFKWTSETAIKLAREDLNQKEKEEQERNNNEFQSQHSIINKNAIMQKELKRMRKQKDELIAQINQLENHNKKLTEALVKFSKDPHQHLKITTPPSITLKHDKKQVLPSFDTKNVSIIKGAKAGPIRDLHSSFNANYSTQRNLSVKQLKQIMEQIYDSKLKFDQKNYQGKIARETMNQYIFTYLNQKYGLKSLTIQAASSIVSGIQQHSSDDNDVAVFGKILRNQVDQEFRFVQAELKTTIHDLLKMHIKTKLPYKSANQIADIMNEKIAHYINYEQAEDIVKYLYNKADSISIMQKLESLFETKHKEESSHRRRRGEQSSVNWGKGKIRFVIFLQNVLNFQLKNHQKLLKPLVNAFKMKDSDSDGIVNEEEFIKIIEVLSDDATNLIPSLLQIVDPYDTKTITFTQMVRLVANYPQDNPILSRFVTKNTEYLFEDQS